MRPKKFWAFGMAAIRWQDTNKRILECINPYNE